ncbi:hypothetical protein LTSERUB_2319 [Salmonella enterica subsp. enterica serovar Rubislaw str. A4-653]|uniref:Uncharacterized protein n=1 Tax=Salmonella enterica subsp. enterica serovar Rubislaw str. A4-653 TaxID=913081 RepID=G5QIE7_SALRU|nr:hypothetical protein LTSERUB_2319 [Salmonella enterica subsp. enterica serovar Rubislaw str. A4-653]
MVILIILFKKKARLTGGPGIVWLITAVHTPPAIRKCATNRVMQMSLPF